MKRVILSLIAVCSTLISFSQDVIVTVDEQQIQAKILEISNTEIKYLDYNNQDGPIYVLTNKEVLSVQLANGDIKTYEQELPKNVVEPTTITTTTITTTMSDISPNLIRSGNRYYYRGMEMRGDVYANFLKNNCTEAYGKYQNGRTIATVGWVLFGVGLGLDLGLVWISPYSGLIGLACEIACIPTLIVGYNRMHSSAEIFNVSCGRNSFVSLGITASQNGVGLALNF